MKTEFITYTFDSNVALLTLNRPEVLNSFHSQMAKELQSALERAKKDSNVRALLLTGDGRAFCAGQDLAEVAPKDGVPLPDLGKIVRENYNPIIRGIREIEKPVVCAVNGTAAGAGANLAFACDIVLASENASFIQSFSKVGLIPDSGGTFFLPRLVGLSRATALMMLGEKLSAKEAKEIGLIYKVCPGESLMKEALELAIELAKQPTFGFGLLKRGLNASCGNNLHEQLKLEEELQRAAGKSHDYEEGVRAFLEKRKPMFTGN